MVPGKRPSPKCGKMPKHGFPPEMQLAAANFFRRELLGVEELMAMPEVTTLPEEELNVTPNGRVLELKGARTIFELNAAREEALPDHPWDAATVRELIGARSPDELAKPQKWAPDRVRTRFPSEPTQDSARRIVLDCGDGIHLHGGGC